MLKEVYRPTKEHIEKIRKSVKAHYVEHPKPSASVEEKAENVKKYRQRYLDFNKEKRLALISLLGGRCASCNFQDSRALQIDHIKGGGSIELKNKNKSGGYYSQAIIDSILNKEGKYQLLCANCNWIKRIENEESRGRPKTVV